MSSQAVGSSAPVRKTPRPSLRSMFGALFVTLAVIAATAAMAVAAQASVPGEAVPTETGTDGDTGTEGDTEPCEPGPPPAVSFAVTDSPGGDPDAPADGTENPAEPEPCPVESLPSPTTTPPPVRIDANNDSIDGIQDQALDPFDVTENDVILPSLGTIEVLTGDMPAGLTLWVDNSLEGWVIGTPTECGSFAVEYQVTATSTSADDGPTDKATIAIEVSCTSAPAPIDAVDDGLAATTGERLEADVVKNDELAAAITHIELAAGTLPPGLTLWAGGWLTGTPTETGDFTFTYTAFGTGGSTSTATISLAVREAAE